VQPRELSEVVSTAARCHVRSACAGVLSRLGKTFTPVAILMLLFLQFRLTPFDIHVPSVPSCGAWGLQIFCAVARQSAAACHGPLVTPDSMRVMCAPMCCCCCLSFQASSCWHLGSKDCEVRVWLPPPHACLAVAAGPCGRLWRPVAWSQSKAKARPPAGHVAGLTSC